MQGGAKDLFEESARLRRHSRKLRAHAQKVCLRAARTRQRAVELLTRLQARVEGRLGVRPPLAS